MRIFFEKSMVYKLAGTMEGVRMHISKAAESWSQFSIKWGKYPDALWIFPNPLPEWPNSEPKFYYPYFQGKLLATPTGIVLNGKVSIGGAKFELLRILLIGLIFVFSYLMLNAIMNAHLYWALAFSLFECSVIWLFLRFCAPSALVYKEKTKALESFLKVLTQDIKQIDDLP